MLIRLRYFWTHDTVPELVKEDLMWASQVLDAIFLDQFQVFDDHIRQIDWFLVFKQSSVALCQLQDVMLAQL